MTHLIRFGASYSTEIQSLMNLVLPVTESVTPHLTSLFFRIGDTNPADAGILHGGIDFNYDRASLNGYGVREVHAPIAGTLIFRDPTDANTGLTTRHGSLYIEDSRGFVHAFFHLQTFSDELLNISIGEQVPANTALGTMGGMYAGSPRAYPSHVHYEVLLPNSFATGTRADGTVWTTGSAIDPIIYWTPGINPTPGASTGLTVLVTPVSTISGLGVDVDGNGVIEATEVANGSYVTEGKSSYLKLGVNTPHTQPIVLRLQFNAPTPNLDIQGVGGVTVWNELYDTGCVYVTLPATSNQTNPNTSGYIRITGLEDDNDSTSEALRYTVTAGYGLGSSFTAYGTNLFTPAAGNLFVLDNDIDIATDPLPDTVTTIPAGFLPLLQSRFQQYPPLPAIIVGTEFDDYSAGTDMWLAARANTKAIYGMGGNDQIDGDGVSGIHLYGGNGDGVSDQSADFICFDPQIGIALMWVNTYNFDGPASLLHQYGYFQNELPRGEGAWIDGEGGSDILYGGLVDDVIAGGTGHDFVHGERGKSANGASLGSGFLLRSTSSIPGVVHRGPDLDFWMKSRAMPHGCGVYGFVPIGHDGVIRWNGTLYRQWNSYPNEVRLAA